MKLTWTDKIRHYFNPLHIMCRLIDMGMPTKRARKWSRTYEIFFKLLL